MYFKENYNGVIVVLILVMVALLIIYGDSGSFIPILILMIIGKFFMGRHLDHAPMMKQYRMVEEAVTDSETNKKEIEKIKLYTDNNVNNEYKVLGLVSVLEINKENTRLALQIQAYRLGSDAVINVVPSMVTARDDGVNAIPILTKVKDGHSVPRLMHYYEGYAVKFLQKR
jgi:hypothetical protein